MNINSSNPAPLPPTIPFNLARAYGLNAGAQPVAAIRGTGETGVAGALGQASAGRKTAPAHTAQLVAGVVPGGVDFSATTPAPSRVASAYPLYRRPTDTNEVATAVLLGRTLDTQG